MTSESLSDNEIELVKNSWDVVKKDGKHFGNQLFIDFFTKHPTYQQNFKSLANIPLSELGSSKRLLAHTTGVMYALTSLVDNLDDTEVVVEMLAKTGDNHRRRRLDVRAFDELGVVFIDLLRTALGANVLDGQLLNAWSKTYSLIVAHIKTAFQ
ncbi:unnamed protein product [Medioppia subpectinata]|uniref:Globin domain-containing protein n=1 Tax=Medioppia subpectinata TaxID=1979941 RepID=A0A7R9Q739_9ACAR|nr:unnamed protein product [Medioppia subpectinata]CAG2114399.1 unnamed protein product [Medioppia subpectinata]